MFVKKHLLHTSANIHSECTFECACESTFNLLKCCNIEYARRGTAHEWRQSLHRHPRVPSEYSRRLLEDGVSGEHPCDCHDHKGSGTGTGEFSSQPAVQTAGDFYFCVTFVTSIKQDDNSIIPTQADGYFFWFAFIDFDYGVPWTSIHIANTRHEVLVKHFIEPKNQNSNAGTQTFQYVFAGTNIITHLMLLKSCFQIKWDKCFWTV